LIASDALVIVHQNKLGLSCAKLMAHLDLWGFDKIFASFDWFGLVKNNFGPINLSKNIDPKYFGPQKIW